MKGVSMINKLNRFKRAGIVALFGLTFIGLTGCNPIADIISSVVYSDKAIKYNYFETRIEDHLISVSKGEISDDNSFTLEERGIVFNQEDLGKINRISFDVSIDSGATYLYLGSTPLGIEEVHHLVDGLNTFRPSGDYGYFVIQNESEKSQISNLSFEIDEEVEHEWAFDELQSIDIRTPNSQAVFSKIDFLECTIFTSEHNDVTNKYKGQIRVRGNSTSKRPKLPYRIKLDSKAPLFGYKPGKNWVLLADFMDGSRIHNYSALTFAQLLKEEGTYAPTPMHLKLYLNGDYQGIYLLCEHTDEKANRLELSQKEVFNLSFDEINFYIERDDTCLQDRTKKEGEDYFRIGTYYYDIKYPQKEDFEEELEDGSIDQHLVEYKAFFNSLKNYMEDITEEFESYSKNRSLFERLSSKVDIGSLVNYALVDQFVNEMGHNTRSFKMYRRANDKLTFGPSWDFDSQSFGLPYYGYYISEPFSSGSQTFQNLDTHVNWSQSLFQDLTNGRPLFKQKWNSVDKNALSEYSHNIRDVVKMISKDLLKECSKWMDSNYCSLFDNIRYALRYIDSQVTYLNEYYA